MPEAERPRIVIVDDNQDILQTTSALLDVAGYETTTVNRAALILPTLQRVRPAVLLQDVYMPDLELRSLIQNIRADAALARTPVLLFTASVEGEDIVTRVGADGILRKPFEWERLRDVIESFIHGAHAHAA